MLVVLYNFSKRENSTKQVAPNNPTAKSLQCELKNECNLTNPVLLISPNILPGTFTPTAYNYCSIPYWERYYFVKNWTYKNAVWEVELAVDVLASFKSQIGQTSTYIERSASDYDGNIIDSIYPSKTNFTITYTSLADSWNNVGYTSGTFVIGCLNYQSSNHIGAVTYYALTQSQMNSLLNYLYSDSIFNEASISEIGEGLWKSLFNPFQYIVSCIWFPFSTAAFGSTSTYVKVGYWTTTVSGIMATSVAEKTYVTGTIPVHPSASARGNYLNYAPFSRHTLYIPPFGSIELDTTFKSKGNYIYSAVTVDHITGMAHIRVSQCQSSSSVNELNIQTERSAMLGVPIQIASIMVDSERGISSALSTVGSIFNIDGMGIITGVKDAILSQIPKVSSLGSNGSFTTQIMSPVLISEFAQLVDEDRAEMGRPLCQVRAINSLSGFVKCTDADHEFSCTIDEKSMINTYLKDGFFYE